MSTNSFVILLAGGSGNRMRGAVRDKCLEPLAGVPVLAHSIRAFAQARVANGLIIVCRDDAQEAAIKDLLADSLGDFLRSANGATLRFARGGAERQDSVLNGLEACGGVTQTAKSAVGANVADSALAFIHDAARPLVKPELLRQLAETAARHGAAVLARRVKDTIKQIPSAVPAPAPVPAVSPAVSPAPPLAAAENTSPALSSSPVLASSPASSPSPVPSPVPVPVPVLLRDLDRSTLWAMETPQVFRRALILDAYRRVKADSVRITDDVAAATHVGHKVAIVENLFPNPKITEPHDLAWVEFLLKTAPA
jgi:2-C-methyl-D-erythritol 4-phosphate cytidylyltransferase